MNNDKLEIFAYNKNYPKIFDKKKQELLKILDGVEIHHIGSTAIPGMGGKGFIDILIGLDDWNQGEDIINKLKAHGFNHIHPKENERIFVSKEPGSMDYDTHLHIVLKNSKAYKEILFFRDFMKENPMEAKKYFELKLQLLKEAKANRKKYTQLKANYINRICDIESTLI